MTEQDRIERDRERRRRAQRLQNRRLKKLKEKGPAGKKPQEGFRGGVHLAASFSRPKGFEGPPDPNPYDYVFSSLFIDEEGNLVARTLGCSSKCFICDPKEIRSLAVFLSQLADGLDSKEKA